MIGFLSERLRERLAELLAAELGHAPEEVAVEPGGFRTPDGRFHRLAEAAALAEADLSELLRYEPGQDDKVEAFSAQAAEVQVDLETGLGRTIEWIRANLDRLMTRDYAV